eukprot:TRINITY_DN16_c0_g1_i5.p1 TRINITY_DN16_c0_g1~~TRINITY_DN16_c0_g1_i5.p1  ORF type:complete len:283 (-),score=25.26 TRINITY_DN16_c0_g1_i5:13-861(-)
MECRMQCKMQVKRWRNWSLKAETKTERLVLSQAQHDKYLANFSNLLNDLLKCHKHPGHCPKCPKIHWKKIGTWAYDVAASARGHIMVVGKGKSIWSYLGGRRWKRFPGVARRIALSPDGRPHIINAHSQIWYRHGGRYHKIPGYAMDISYGGRITIIGTNVETYGFGIYQWMGRHWKKLPGSGTQVSVDYHGRPWIVNKYHYIFRWAGRKFIHVPGKAIDIGVGVKGDVWIIGTNHHAYKWTGRGWKNYGGNFRRIDVGPKGPVATAWNHHGVYLLSKQEIK